MDFFAPQCQSGPFTDLRFGVCDDQQGLPAYVDTANESAWIATVINDSQTPVTFTAIDKCVLGDADAQGRGRCDAMLTTDSLLYLLELKDKNVPWMERAWAQLESTIQLLLAHHGQEMARYRKKKAFACNRRYPAFVELTQEHNRRFMQYGFRLDTQATVVLVS